MQATEMCSRDEFSVVIINELKEIGVKYRKDKKSKLVQEKICHKRIFRTHLHLLELTDVFLSNGRVVQIPKFVADACNRILEQVETEGIFRKAGSSIRQKEIRIGLEAGLPLGKSHHVIDVANVIKYFFRELPEPLIPPSMQETLLRSLLIGENHIKAILLTCLLLPPLTISTLSFFMQFLNTVSIGAHCNKMTVQNLAIIFTPGLMPFSNIASHRFTNHVKMVQLLIENANFIGIIPDNIIEKLQINENISSTPKSNAFNAVMVTQKKKKKRRSGSLTQMFNGLRKIVGSAIGSSENLESTPCIETGPSPMAADQVQSPKPPLATPRHKPTKKRKFTDPMCAFSAKKKKDLRALLPSNSGGFLPNTPVTKEQKKSRLSLGGSRHIKNISINPVVTSMERRWSIVGSGWSKPKNKIKDEIKDNFMDSDSCSLVLENVPSPIVSETKSKKSEYPVIGNVSGIRYPNNEYEAIKERVDAIESRISHEFGTIQNSLMTSLRPQLTIPAENSDTSLSELERVQTKYEQMIVDTEAMCSPGTEKFLIPQLENLKIRRNSEQRVIRSPSARKIGTIRRRSQEKVRLSRNQTWHISSTANSVHISGHQQELPTTVQQHYFYAKSNLKRGRPNTLYTGLIPQQNTPIIEKPPSFEPNTSIEKNDLNEQWTSGEVFFNDDSNSGASNEEHNILNSKYKFDKHLLAMKSHDAVSSTPVKRNLCLKANSNGNIQTPMLPPKSVPRIRSSPNSAMKLSAGKVTLANRIVVPTSVDGRASIARLRAQNAGMVLAKAKLFDGLSGNSSSELESQTVICNDNVNTNRRTSRCFIAAPKGQTEVEDRKCVQIISMEYPVANRIAVKSPCLTNKRQSVALFVKPYKQEIDAVVANGKKSQSRKIYDKPFIRNPKNSKQSSKIIGSPRTSKSRHRLHLNSPRRIRNEPHHSHSPNIANAQLRNSPRFVKPKVVRNVAI